MRDGDAGHDGGEGETMPDRAPPRRTESITLRRDPSIPKDTVPSQLPVVQGVVTEVVR